MFKLNFFHARVCFIKLLAVLSTAACGLWSCGYHMVEPGALPNGVTSVAVTVLENKTAETGLEAVISNALITELSRYPKGKLAPVDRADAVLSGEISWLRRETISRSGSQTPLERRVSVIVSLNLEKADGTTIWHEHKVQAAEAYPVSFSDKLKTETSRRFALQRLSQRLAESVVRQLANAF